MELRMSSVGLRAALSRAMGWFLSFLLPFAPLPEVLTRIFVSYLTRELLSIYSGKTQLTLTHT